MTIRLTRRAFLRFSAAAAAAPLLPRLNGRTRAHPGLRFDRAPTDPPIPAFPAPGPDGLGRATTWGVALYDKPAYGAARVGALAADDVISIYAAVTGDALLKHNDVWFETLDGYAYSSFVQPVENSPQKPLERLPEKGCLAEISVPYVDSRRGPGADTGRDYRLYYGTVYRVMSATADASGQVWYGLDDAGGFQATRYVPAESMRRIRPEDLAPLSPGADKYIHVSISKQILEAFEGTRKVFEARVASGTWYNVDGELQDFTTPLGKWTVVRKRPSSHMKGGTEGKSDYYDLPGVPFCTYFTWTAAAVHGAYWHNDFGHSRSHGCLNVLPRQARWVYRWSEPAIAYDEERLDVEEGGTVIEVES